MTKNDNIQSLNNLIDGLVVLKESHETLNNASEHEIISFLDSLQAINSWVDEIVDFETLTLKNSEKAAYMIEEVTAYFGSENEVKSEEPKQLFQRVTEIGKTVTTNKLQ